jgi:hypothetical protein
VFRGEQLLHLLHTSYATGWLQHHCMMFLRPRSPIVEMRTFCGSDLAHLICNSRARSRGATRRQPPDLTQVFGTAAASAIDFWLPDESGNGADWRPYVRTHSFTARRHAHRPSPRTPGGTRERRRSATGPSKVYEDTTIACGAALSRRSCRSPCTRAIFQRLVDIERITVLKIMKAYCTVFVYQQGAKMTDLYLFLN